jgi:hypothetical protein
MNFRLVITAVLFQTAVISFAQTKEDFYQSVNRFESNYVSIFKDNKIPNKEAFLLNATIHPIYKFVLTEKKNRINHKVQGYYYIVYDDRIYFYKNGVSESKLGNDETNKYLKIKKTSIKIGSFTDFIYYDGIEFIPVIIDEENNLIIDYKEKYNNISSYLNIKYGSFEKYKEIAENEIIREKLSVKDIQESIKNNYKKFEYNCPKDTLLVLKTFINQIKQAVGEISKEQEQKLIERIKIKLNPFDFLYKDIKDVKIKELILKSKEKSEEAKKKIIRYEGNYDFLIYNVNITDDLLTVLTNKQFQDYKNYNDIRFPVIEVNDIFRSKRYEYGREILQKEKLINLGDYKNYDKYANKIVSDCGCPFDQTVTREIMIK